MPTTKIPIFVVLVKAGVLFDSALYLWVSFKYFIFTKNALQYSFSVNEASLASDNLLSFR